ncbi:MAG: EAL domain-containing protein [Ignavibacteriales bacterium]
MKGRSDSKKDPSKNMDHEHPSSQALGKFLWSSGKEDLDGFHQRMQLLADIIDHSSQPFSLVATDGTIVDCNPAFYSLTGYSKEELSSISWDKNLTPSEWWPTQKAALETLAKTGEPQRYEKEYVRKDGTRVVVELLVHLLKDPSTDTDYYYSFITDISRRKAAEEALRRSEMKYRMLFENSPLGIFHYTQNGILTDCNDNFSKIMGTEKELLIGYNMLAIQDPTAADAIKQALSGALARFEGQYTAMTSGKSTPVEVLFAPIFEQDDVFLGGVAIMADITQRKNYENTIHHLAYHDVLTNLPNRLMLSENLTAALSVAAAKHSMMALMFLDLDNFKLINDTMGHTEGDNLLQEVAKRLDSLVRAGDLVARVGGDEFVFLFRDIIQREDTTSIADKILESFAAPFNFEDHEINITASMGISIYPDDGDNSTTLMKNADTALYQAKEQGRSNYQFFTPDMNSTIFERLTMEKNLRQAIDRREFVLYYQPLINTVTGQIETIEALIRWQHPIEGLILPGKFIPLAEETGLIIPIENWVLFTACAQNKAWQKLGYPPVRIAVNISGRHFWKQDLIDTIAEILGTTGLDPKYLEIEITESTAIQNVDMAQKILIQLRELGIHIALDDFGTGFSSLNYLKRLPLDSLKIDQTFIRDLAESISNIAIPEAVIQLAKNLNLTVTAEGVETQNQMEILRELDCPRVQGFLFCRPQSKDGMSTYLKSHQEDENH